MVPLHTAIPHTRRVHEIKVHQIIDAKLLELQDNGTQVGTEDLGVCVVLHLILVCLLWEEEGEREMEGGGEGGRGGRERGRERGREKAGAEGEETVDVDIRLTDQITK